MKENEIWKPVKNFEESYEVSNLGKVRSINRYRYCKSKNKPNLFKGKILKQRADKNGYMTVNLKQNQKSSLKKVHRLVAIAFLSTNNPELNINHKDGNKQNNKIENLEWCTVKENTQHRTKNLLVKPKLTKEQVINIIENCRSAKNQVDNKNSISNFAKMFNVDRRTISDIIKGKKLYLEKLCS